MSAVLVTGAGGLVGSALVRTGRVHGLGHAALDITDPDQIRAVLRAHRPRALINAAAQAGVDRAEVEPSLSFLVNGAGPARLAEVCADENVRLVHISTDYVLSGPDRPGLRLDESWPPEPRSTYARSKLEGEGPVLASGGVVARVQWVHAPGPRGFFAAALRRLAQRQPLSLVTDQVGCPSPAPLVARWLLDLAQPGGPTGLVHLAPDGEASAFDWIAAAARSAGLCFRARPCRRADFGGAHRPARSCLSNARARSWGLRIPHWQESLDRMLRSHPR